MRIFCIHWQFPALPATSIGWLCKLTVLAMVAFGAVHAQTGASAASKGISRDFLVELRQVRDDGAGDSNAVTWKAAPTQTQDSWSQNVRVRHGEKATLQWQTSQPMQWMQSLQFQSSNLTAASASSTSQAGGMTQALVWMDSGQSWTVTPYWTGAKQPVRLDIELKVAGVRDSHGSDLPATQRQQVSTSVSAPLGQWITLAATGQAAQRGTYSSQPNDQGRTLVQVRVSLP